MKEKVTRVNAVSRLNEHLSATVGKNDAVAVSPGPPVHESFEALPDGGLAGLAFGLHDYKRMTEIFMPYKNRKDLPEQVSAPLRQVPHAQDIYLAAFNSAIEEYDGEESRAHAVAWAAVKDKYEKGDDDLWHPKD